MKVKSTAKQLDGFLAKYYPEIRAFARAALAKLRSRLPGSGRSRVGLEFLAVSVKYSAPPAHQ